MLALLELLLSELAAHKRVAVLVHSVGEVLAGHADPCSLPALKLQVVNESPLLQRNHRD